MTEDSPTPGGAEGYRSPVISTPERVADDQAARPLITWLPQNRHHLPKALPGNSALLAPGILLLSWRIMWRISKGGGG